MIETIEIADATLATDEEAIGTQALRRKTRPQKGDRHFGRASVTNGRRLHTPPTAGNATWQRRFKDIYQLIVEDIGPDLTEGQRQLARRVSMLSIACEKMESKAAAGHDYDHQTYSMYTDQLGRTLQCLGLKQQAATSVAADATA